MSMFKSIVIQIKGQSRDLSIGVSYFETFVNLTHHTMSS
jgi:hypothetical protein